jgi:DNA-binding transcriptional MerR regulator
MAKQAQRETATLDTIPDKLYFRIGEVASLCGVETYVLRFWQTEFPQLAPKKSGTGQRLYRKRDVEQALRIKRLLHDEGYTITGARQVFAAEAQEQRQHPKALDLPLPPQTESVEARQAREQVERAADRAQARLARMRLELRELHGILSQPPGSSPSRATGPQRTAPTPVHRGDKGNLFENEPS